VFSHTAGNKVANGIVLFTEIEKEPGFKPYRACKDKLDTLKLYSKAHGAKVDGSPFLSPSTAIDGHYAENVLVADDKLDH
jgi:hypothetical protein